MNNTTQPQEIIELIDATDEVCEPAADDNAPWYGKVKSERIPELFLEGLNDAWKLGGRYLEIGFSGSGDSGDFEYPSFFKDNRTWEYNSLISGGEAVIPRQNVQDYLETLVERHIDTDWYNDDGGGGTVRMSLETLKVEITSYYNETVQHDGDSAEVDLQEVGEEVPF